MNTKIPFELLLRLPASSQLRLRPRDRIACDLRKILKGLGYNHIINSPYAVKRAGLS